jgi:hypothetical protein
LFNFYNISSVSKNSQNLVSNKNYCVSQVSEILRRKKENGKEKLFVSYVHYPISGVQTFIFISQIVKLSGSLPSKKQNNNSK